VRLWVWTAAPTLTGRAHLVIRNKKREVCFDLRVGKVFRLFLALVAVLEFEVRPIYLALF
jgi:hypothetical protein